MAVEGDQSVVPVGNRAAPWIVLACAATAAVAVAVPPLGSYRYRIDQRGLYDWTSWLHVLALAVAGLLIAVASRHRLYGAIVAVAAGAHLAGTGVVAHRRWFTSGGFSSPADNLLLLRCLAAVLAVAGAVAVAVGAYVLWASRDAERQYPTRRSAARVAVLALVLAVLVPFAMGSEYTNPTTQLGSYALMYSLPWASVLMLTIWLDRRSSLVAVAAVVTSALVMWAGPMMIAAPRPGLGSIVAVITCLVAVGVTSRSHPHDTKTRRPTNPRRRSADL